MKRRDFIKISSATLVQRQLLVVLPQIGMEPIDLAQPCRKPMVMKLSPHFVNSVSGSAEFWLTKKMALLRKSRATRIILSAAADYVRVGREVRDCSMTLTDCVSH
jgi:hypothetical protein